MQSLKNHVAYPSLGNHMSPGRAMRIPARWTIPERQQKHAATTVSPTASGTSGPRDGWCVDGRMVGRQENAFRLGSSSVAKHGS